MRPTSRAPRYPTTATRLDRREAIKLTLAGVSLALLPRCDDEEADSRVAGEDAGALPPLEQGDDLAPIRLPAEGAFYAYHWDEAAAAELSWSYALIFEVTEATARYCASHEGVLRGALISAVRFTSCQAPPEPAPVEAALRAALEEGLGQAPRLEGFELRLDHCAEADLAGGSPGW